MVRIGFGGFIKRGKGELSGVDWDGIVGLGDSVRYLKRWIGIGLDRGMFDGNMAWNRVWIAYRYGD